MKKIVIIGGDAAGMSAASKIRRLEPDSELVVFEKGAYISFAACGIPYWISGVVDDGSKLQVLTPQLARENRGIDVRTRHEVLEISRKSKRLSVKNHDTGEVFQESYDSLLIATGARAQQPPFPGLNLPGVFTLRNLTDGFRIKEYIEKQKIKHATIIGGGYIGLEMAEAFRQLNLDVSLIEMLDQIAPTFDKDMMGLIQEHLVENEVDLKLNTRVQAIEKTSGTLQVKTSEGDVSTDMVIVSTGVRPNSELAQAAGLRLGKSGAISVNEHMQSSDSDIYAAGDCAEHVHLVSRESVWIPLATSANKGGKVAAENLAGKSAVFPGVLGTAVVKVFEYTIAQTGLNEVQAQKWAGKEAIETVTIKAGSRSPYFPGSEPITVKLIVDKSSRRLLGSEMVGKSDVAKRIDVLATAITAGMTVENIAMLDLSYAPPFAPVYDPILVAANVASREGIVS